MWGPYLVHKRILMIDKQIEHAVDYFSKAYINKSGCSAVDSLLFGNQKLSPTQLIQLLGQIGIFSRTNLV